MFNFIDLDAATRQWMLDEFQKEYNSANPYYGKSLTAYGRQAYVIEMKRAIQDPGGNEATLAIALSLPSYWMDHPESNAQRLAITEFNTWYVRGLCRCLIEENVEECEVYRAGPAVEPRAECTSWEGRHFKVRDVYNGHRARYWPNPNPGVFSIPAGANCHHSIKRIR
jgi:hypothetical protein